MDCFRSPRVLMRFHRAGRTKRGRISGTRSCPADAVTGNAMKHLSAHAAGHQFRVTPEGAPREGAAVDTETMPQARTMRDCKVVLFNDEEHTYDYVVEMLTHTCRLARTEAFRCAVEVDLTGRTIVF